MTYDLQSQQNQHNNMAYQTNIIEKQPPHLIHQTKCLENTTTHNRKTHQTARQSLETTRYSFKITYQSHSTIINYT